MILLRGSRKPRRAIQEWEIKNSSKKSLLEKAGWGANIWHRIFHKKKKIKDFQFEKIKEKEKPTEYDWDDPIQRAKRGLWTLCERPTCITCAPSPSFFNSSAPVSLLGQSFTFFLRFFFEHPCRIFPHPTKIQAVKKKYYAQAQLIYGQCR